MMRSIKTLALCLAASTALTLAIAATASAAEPIFQKVIVVPVKEGEKIAFTGTGLKSTLESIGKQKITCLTVTGKGEIDGPTGIDLALTFKGCESSATKCTSTGAAEGEVLWNNLEGKLGNLKSGSTPGVALSQSKEKTNDAEFTCGTTKVKIFGGVVGPITTIGKVTTKLTLTYTEKAGIQLFESLFGGPLDVLSTQFGEAAAEQSGLVAKIALKLSEEVEVS